MITLDAFWRELRETGKYTSHPENLPAVRATPSTLTTFRYTKGILHVFPASAVAEAFGRLTIEKWASYCLSSVTTAERLGMRVLVEGFAERQRYDGPVMYLCNHLSTTETILLPPVLLAFGPLSYVAKAALAHLPFLERAAVHTRMVPIGRRSPREDLVNLLNVGTERMRGGENFLIFPQGTRSAVFSRSRYSSIGAKLAEKAGCPIVPIVIDTRCQPTREEGLLKGILHDFGPVDPARDIRCCAGPVIPCGKSREMHEAAFEWMAGKLEEWGMPVERAV